MTPEPFAYSLEQVAELTGISLRRIKDGCRAEEIPHTLYRGARVMTREHIAAFLSANEIRGEDQPAEPPAEVARMEAHRRRVANRLGKKARVSA